MMEYILAFLEGIITFISPCLLPMIPIYILYFTGEEEGRSRAKSLSNALAFVLGFTTVFVVLGAFAGTLGGFLVRYRWLVNIVAGIVVVIFGLNYLGLFEKVFGRNLFGGGRGKTIKITGFLSAYLFGIVFSISWTPCLGVFLGSALMLASVKASALYGVLMLLCYSAGLGIPFVLSAVLVNRLKAGFDFIKRHHRVINCISGIFLVIVGILMATGQLGRLLVWLSLKTPV